MSYQVIWVTFDVDAQSHKAGIFSMPADVCEILGGLKNGDPVNLVVQSTDGAQLYAGKKTLASSREIYGPDLKDHIKAGQRIRVTVSKP